MTMIEIVNLSMRLTGGGGEVSILDDITLTIPAKQFVAIVGPSGSGKSTLLGLIAGLDAPSAGAIILDGLELGSLSEDELARMRLHTLGYVFQSFHLIPTLTALENVAVPLELAESPDVRSKAEALLHAVGLGERARHYPIQLSGGAGVREPAAGVARR